MVDTLESSLPIETTGDAADYVRIIKDGVSSLMTVANARLLLDNTGSAPTIRGTASNNGTSSVTVTHPAGSAEGDDAYIIAAGGNYSTVPTGWTTVETYIANGWSFRLMRKTLTAGDISTGSVTVSFTGSFSEHVVMVVFEGATSGLTLCDYRAVPSAQRTLYFNGVKYTSRRIEKASKVFVALTARANQDNLCSDGTSLQNSKRTNGSLRLFELTYNVEGVDSTVTIPGDGGYDPIMLRFAVTA